MSSRGHSNRRSRSRSRSRDRDKRSNRDGRHSRDDGRFNGDRARRAVDDPRRPRDMDSPRQRSGNRERGSNRNDPAPSASDATAVWGNASLEEEANTEPVAVVAKANFGVTGALAKDTATGNVFNGVVLKWSEPGDAARPDRNWRLYVFQGDELVDTLHIHRQSAYLLGREEKVADIKLMNPSISKQHAVIQFRRTPTVIKPAASDVDEAVVKKTVKPYILDLDSTNKTFLNGAAVEGSRYIELKPKDLLKFGESSKEYVLICE